MSKKYRINTKWDQNGPRYMHNVIVDLINELNTSLKVPIMEKSKSDEEARSILDKPEGIRIEELQAIDVWNIGKKLRRELRNELGNAYSFLSTKAVQIIADRNEIAKRDEKGDKNINEANRNLKNTIVSQYEVIEKKVEYYEKKFKEEGELGEKERKLLVYIRKVYSNALREAIKNLFSMAASSTERVKIFPRDEQEAITNKINSLKNRISSLTLESKQKQKEQQKEGYEKVELGKKSLAVKKTPTNKEQNFYKILKDFNLQKPFHNISPNSWDKIKIEASGVTWDNITTAFRSNNNLMFDSNDRFISQEVYRDFSKFIDPNTVVRLKGGAGKVAWKDLDWQKHAILEDWNTICANWFKNSNKMLKGSAVSFFNSGSLQLLSQEAYVFLRKYIGTSQFKINYSQNSFFDFEEFKNDRVTLNDQVIIINNQQQVSLLKAEEERLRAENANLQSILNQRPTQEENKVLQNNYNQLGQALNLLKFVINSSFPGLIDDENNVNEEVRKNLVEDLVKLKQIQQQVPTKPTSPEVGKENKASAEIQTELDKINNIKLDALSDKECFDLLNKFKEMKNWTFSDNEEKVDAAISKLSELKKQTDKLGLEVHRRRWKQKINLTLKDEFEEEEEPIVLEDTNLTKVEYIDYDITLRKKASKKELDDFGYEVIRDICEQRQKHENIIEALDKGKDAIEKKDIKRAEEILLYLQFIENLPSQKQVFRGERFVEINRVRRSIRSLIEQAQVVQNPK